MRHTVTPSELSKSVMAVPPLARSADGAFNAAANGNLIRHMEAGGVSTILYGGNALAHHWPPSRYGDWLDRLEALCAPHTWLLPSVGPDGGKLFDQAGILRDRRFPVALLLPMDAPRTEAGTAEALRRFHGASGVELLIYIKTDGYIAPSDLEALVGDGVVFGVKYAVTRDSMGPDAYLSDIIRAIGTDRVISGFGEPRAIPHMLDHGLAGYTAGCVCPAPALSMSILAVLKAGSREGAERLLAPILLLEACRERINEIRVLHDAIGLSGLAPMGPILPPSSHIPNSECDIVARAAKDLLTAEEDHRAGLVAA